MVRVQESAGRVQCIAVYIRVDRRAQCDDDVLTAALLVLASNSKSACCPATSPNRSRLHQKHKLSPVVQIAGPSIQTQSTT